MKYSRHFMLILLLTLGGYAMSLAQENSNTVAPALQKARIIVTTDPELDDLNSLIRFFALQYR